MLDKLYNLLHREPVAVVNGVAALVAIAAGYGLDVDAEGIGAALGALLVLTGVTRSNVYSPATVDEVIEAADEVLDVLLDESEAGE